MALPNLSKALKTLALIVLLSNFKSLPFLWHIRLFRHTFRIAFYRRLLGRTTFRALPPSTKPSESLFRTFTHTRRNWLDDTDFFWHMSNSVYNKVFDFSRMELLCHVFPEIVYDTKKQGIKMAFGGASVVFVREIPILRKYNVHARVVSWSRKWLYIQGVFTLPASSSSNNTKSEKKGSYQLPAALNNIIADPGMSSGTSTPTTITGGSSVGPTTASGEIICAVIYGRYVFKRKSRETIPVGEVLGICGYTGDQEIERRRAEGWEYVKGLEQDWEKERALESAQQY